MYRAAIRDVAGLTEALQAAGGGQAITEYGQVQALNGYPASFPPASHQHPASDITGTLAAARIPTLAQAKIDGLQAALDARPPVMIVTDFASVTTPPAAGTMIFKADA